MKKVVITLSKKIVLGIIIAIILILTFSFIRGYNKLVGLDETIDRNYHEIENRLQQRSDKIAQIVASVSGLEEHEKAIYDRIMAARMAYQNAKSTEDLIEADAAQASAFSSFLVVVEDNPNLVAQAGFLTLMDEISLTEASLFVSRRDYNEAVLKYNNQVRRFPYMLYQSMFNFQKSYTYWKMNDGASEVPNIDFS